MYMNIIQDHGRTAIDKQWVFFLKLPKKAGFLYWLNHAFLCISET